MKTLKFWLRPAIIALIWVVMSAFTLAELATVAPALRAAGAAPQRVQEVRHSLTARSQAGRGSAIAP